MRAKYAGNKADRILHVVKSGESTLTIPRGSPLILGTTNVAAPETDGLAVMLPSSGGSAPSFQMRYGVATQSMAPGEYGETILFGIAPYALLQKITRAATTASWSAVASSAGGFPLGIDTVANIFIPGATIAGSVESNMVQAVLLDSLAAIAGSASNTSDTRTAIYVGARIFVRML
jgi:hypothetical protein